MRRLRRFRIKHVAHAPNRRHPLPKGSTHRPQAAGIFQNSPGYWELEMGRGLREFLLAVDWPDACQALKRNPLLLMSSASEVLASGIADARQREDVVDKAILQDHMSVLELARQEGIEAALEKLRRIKEEE